MSAESVIEALNDLNFSCSYLYSFEMAVTKDVK